MCISPFLPQIFFVWGRHDESLMIIDDGGMHRCRVLLRYGEKTQILKLRIYYRTVLTKRRDGKKKSQEILADES